MHSPSTSTFALTEARVARQPTEPPPLVPLVLRALLRMHNALTSGFALGLVSKIRVSRGFFSGPYQRCIRMRMQGVRGEMWPVSRGFRGDRHVDVVLGVSLACARIGHAYALH